MSYEITGRVKLLQDAQTFGSGFTKREVVLVVEDGKYPQEINLEFVQDKVGLLDDVRGGDEVTITFDIRGREYNGRYFNSLQGWKLTTEMKGAVPASEGRLPKSNAPSGGGSAEENWEEDDDSIPF